jgi:hypothetical protein
MVRIFLALTTVTPALVSARPAAAELAIGGACVVVLRAVYLPDAVVVPVSPATVTLSETGHSFCTTNVGMGDLTVSGSLTAPSTTGSWGCLSGIVSGTLNVSIDVSGFPNPTVDATAVNIGGVITLIMTSAVVMFDGVAVLVQAPIASAVCAAGAPIDHAWWVGGMVFQDPVAVAP